MANITRVTIPVRKLAMVRTTLELKNGSALLGVFPSWLIARERKNIVIKEAITEKVRHPMLTAARDFQAGFVKSFSRKVIIKTIEPVLIVVICLNRS
jgi:hypothetical protein